MIRGKKMETIVKEEETKEENSGIREWTEENEEKMGNMVDSYYKLQEKKFLEIRKLKRGVVS